MDKIYYQPNHLWKGQKAVKKLAELSGEKPKAVKQWLSRQAFWQVHLPAPKNISRPHYQVTIPNEMHQFDLLCMPSDTLYGSKYKYILAGTDAASRYKVTRPLRTKQARDVAEMIADSYKVGPLKFPKIFQCDNGSEFKGDVTKMLEKDTFIAMCNIPVYTPSSLFCICFVNVHVFELYNNTDSTVAMNKHTLMLLLSDDVHTFLSLWQTV